MTSLVCWFLQAHFCSIWNSSPYLQIPPRVHECFPSRVHWAARFNVIYDLAYLTDCGQPASEHSSESLQQVDEAEMSTKNEDKYNFMDFPVREVAEQLTRLDAVGFVFIKNWSSVFLGWLWEGVFFFSLIFSCLMTIFSPRTCLSKWSPSTAWAASGPNVTKKKTETWHQRSAPPSPSLTLSPTVSSPHSSAHPRTSLPLPPLACHLLCPLTSCTPPLLRAHLASCAPAPVTEHASSRGGSLLHRFASQNI